MSQDENYDKFALLDDTIPPEEMEEVIKHAMTLHDPEIQAQFNDYLYLPIGKGVPIDHPKSPVKRHKSTRSEATFFKMP